MEFTIGSVTLILLLGILVILNVSTIITSTIALIKMNKDERKAKKSMEVAKKEHPK